MFHCRFCRQLLSKEDKGFCIWNPTCSISFLDAKARKAPVGWGASNTPRQPAFQTRVPSLSGTFLRGGQDEGAGEEAILPSKPALGSPSTSSFLSIVIW